MSYLGELRTNWQPLAAATAGLSAGLSLSAYTNAAMAPQFLEEFGWNRSDFVLTGVITLLTFVFLPIYGRLTDLFGVRRIAVIGVIGLPLCWAGYALMSGPIWQYFAINVVLIGLGVTTTPAIYSRIVATCFDKARGLALAIAHLRTTAPRRRRRTGARGHQPCPTVGGWAAGGDRGDDRRDRRSGVVADPGRRGRRPSNPPRGQDRQRLPPHRAHPGVLDTVGRGTAVQPVPHGHHHPARRRARRFTRRRGEVSLLISIFATAVIVGRFACGVALDRFPAQLVAAVAMALPGLGCVLIASSWDSFTVLVVAVGCLGAAWGAEGDVIAYLVARRFDLTLHSTVLSLLSAAIGVSSALGAFLLSRTLQVSESFNGFLVFTGVAAFAGGALFLLLGSQSAVAETAQTAEVDERAQPH